ncbi:anti-sigma factor [Streptomyces sp. NPDC054784]
MTAADLHTMTGAYSVHALPGPERVEFERHMADCPSCAQEVRELTATTERLGLAVSAVPPPEMRQRVLREIQTVRQEPPRVPQQARSGGWSGGRLRALPRFALAAVLAAVAGLGGVAVWQHQEADEARQRADAGDRRAERLAEVLAAPDATVTTGKLPTGASASVVVSRDADRAAFFAAGLPEAPSGKVYQLWFSDSAGDMRPAGLLDSPAAAETVLMDGPVGDASGMGITVEPAGGSAQPTSDPVALMEFATA